MMYKLIKHSEVFKKKKKAPDQGKWGEQHPRVTCEDAESHAATRPRRAQSARPGRGLGNGEQVLLPGKEEGDFAYEPE